MWVQWSHKIFRQNIITAFSPLGLQICLNFVEIKEFNERFLRLICSDDAIAQWLLFDFTSSHSLVVFGTSKEAAFIMFANMSYNKLRAWSRIFNVLPGKLYKFTNSWSHPTTIWSLNCDTMSPPIQCNSSEQV